MKAMSYSWVAATVLVLGLNIQTSQAQSAQGPLDIKWNHGSDPCSDDTDPQFQIVRYDANTYILRENKCISRHAPFSYLFFGSEKAILIGTGANPDNKEQKLQIRKFVDEAIDRWLGENDREQIDLVVAHFHNHYDHHEGDAQFADRKNTVVVEPNLTAVNAFFKFENWPHENVQFDLGGRSLTIIPIPGHTDDSITVYDPDTQLLMTGDSFYPGELFFEDFASYQSSIDKLVKFAEKHPISHILGTHVEITNTPREEYGRGYEPDEHPLQLTVDDLIELRDVIFAMGDTPKTEFRDHFYINPR